MFESLDEEMRRDEKSTSTPGQRWIRYAMVLLVSCVVFGGLYLGIHFLQ